MRSEIKAFGKKYRYVSKKGIEFSPQENQHKAIKNMKELEERLDDTDFVCIKSRKVKWDPSRYLKVMDKSGRHVILDTYFNGDSETIRTKQSVEYDVKGLERDVDSVIRKLNKKNNNEESGKCYTCR